MGEAKTAKYAERVISLESGVAVQAQNLIDAVNAKGCSPWATDLRDAVHEATHALHVESKGVVLKSWNRNTVHRALKKTLNRVGVAESEVLARIVERRVCDHFQVDIGSVAGWDLISLMEAHRDGAAFFDPATYDKVLAKLEKSSIAQDLFDRVLELVQ